MIHQVWFERDGVLLSGRLRKAVHLERLLLRERAVWITEVGRLKSITVTPLEIAKGFARRAREEAEKAAKEINEGAMLGRKDNAREALIWENNVKKLESQQ